MILEHEIPKGSRLYFGKTAKKKRAIENLVSQILDENDFEEIVTPNFSYGQHQSIENSRKLITISDEDNNEVALRADSTLDVVRIINKRLGRTTSHKKWFYIQPIFTYPSNEEYQIGCEWIGHDNITDILKLNIEILNNLEISPILQLSNINIPSLVCKELKDRGVTINTFKNGEIAELFSLNIDWLNSLIKVKSIKDLENAIPAIENIELKKELEKLLETAKELDYKNMVIAPLYYGSLKYYRGIYYRVIHENLVLTKGGSYQLTLKKDGSCEDEEIKSLGFAFYTDKLLKILEDK